MAQRITLVVTIAALWFAVAAADHGASPPRKLSASELESLAKRFAGKVDTSANPQYDAGPVQLPDFAPVGGYPDSAITFCSNAITGRHGDGPPGTVQYFVLVDEQGRVKEWQRIEEQPNGMGFGYEADLTIGRWRFLPAKDGGHPVEVWTTATMKFSQYHVIVK